MILQLKRAVAHIIEQNLPGVRCFASEAVNEDRYYPCVYITEIERKRGPLGCGRVDYVEREPTRKVIKNGKIYEYRTSLRLLIEAAGDGSVSAAEQAHEIDKDLDRMFLEAVKSKQKIVFSDPETGDNMQVVGIHFITAADVPAETESEPLLFRRAVTYRFVHRLHLEEAVERTIDRVLITNGGENV